MERKINIGKALNKPYPFFYRGKILLIILGLLFIMSLWFNYFFEPFEMYVPEHKMDYFWISLIHSSTPLPVLMMLSFLFLFFHKIENWKVGKEIFFLALFFILVGIVQFLIRDVIYDNPNNWSWRYFKEEIWNTFLVGILFACILIPLNLLLRKEGREGSKNINFPNGWINEESPKILINTNLKSESIKLDIDNLLFAKADGNYVEFYTIDGDLDRPLKRITFKELESKLKSFENIFKTHRSYLVNLSHIDSVKGNAQGYKIKLHNFSETIPVSRNKVRDFDKKMSQL